MDNDFHSLSDVREYFFLGPAAQTPDEITEGLRGLLVTLHPDKTGGDFRSEEEERRYHRVQEAIAFVASQKAVGTAMVPLAAIPDLVRAIQVSIQRPVVPWERSVELRNELSTSLRRRSFVPKLTSGVLLTVSTGLLAFLKNASAHPVLGVLASQGWFKYSLMGVWLASAIGFLVSWYHERRAEAKAEFLLSDEALADAFQHVSIGSQYSRKRPGTFRRADLEEAMQCVYRDYHRNPVIRVLLYGPQYLDRTARSRAAEAHIRTLLERRAIRKVDEPGVEEWFEIEASLLPTLKPKTESA
jgi:hypothetical protein